MKSLFWWITVAVDSCAVCEFVGIACQRAKETAIAVGIRL